MRSYIIVCEAGDRSCHYWISTASLNLHTTQSAANACGQKRWREGGRSEKDKKAGRERDAEGKRQGEGVSSEGGE